MRYEELEMPPDDRLSAREIALLENWIRDGAHAPAHRFAGVKSTEASPDKLWSFQPVTNAAVPTMDSEWPRNDVDRFVLERLDREGLSVVEDADPARLSRRIHLDLVGLPPTPEQQARFLEDYARDPAAAIESTVDGLLNTVQFGERWARHWLDTARYAESNGNNRNRVLRYAWRYRNWVIDAGQRR